MRKLILYGDSNTYGYDPRGWLGIRYPEQVRWTTMVREWTAEQFIVIEEGMNGRMLPSIRRDAAFLHQLMDGLTKDDWLVMMLGTNDILLTDHPDATISIQKMEELLLFISKESVSFRFIVIAPPLIAPGISEMARYYDESVRMNRGFAALCEGTRPQSSNETRLQQFGNVSVSFFDAGRWQIPLAADYVHFSEEGHRKFAECFREHVLGEVEYL